MEYSFEQHAWIYTEPCSHCKKKLTDDNKPKGPCLVCDKTKCISCFLNNDRWKNVCQECRIYLETKLQVQS